jgi:ATP-binding cassette subfamily B protein/ATP-binding cassette subfamily C protein LapB
MPVRGHGQNLSGGQRQAVALTRALVARAAFLVLDEPTSGLDQGIEQDIIPKLLAYDPKATLVIASHSVPLLKAMPRLIVVEDGRIVADGPTDKILVG